MFNMRHILSGSAAVILFAVSAAFAAESDSNNREKVLQHKVQKLEQQLAQARQALAESRAANKETELKLEKVQAEAAPQKIELGPFKVGGAMRVNYVLGDYGNNAPNDDAPSRGGDGGNFELDTFRVNVDYRKDQWIGKGEYRFYNGYNFLHTGWFGYDFDDGRQLQVGVNRVPFGPGPYGISQSWFFDQHYYVGLSDDMDLGVKYTVPYENLTLDLAWYLTDEGQWRGDSVDSARYSYDVVDETREGYEEWNQFNVRGIYALEHDTVPSEVGVSLQYSMLDSQGAQDDGDHYAASTHMINKMGNWKLASQLTWFAYQVDPHTVASGAVTDDLIDMGAYDYAWPVAAEAWIPGVSLSYHYDTPQIAWLDYEVPYVEYSTILKTKDAHNDSELFTLGAAWARKGWYIYTDLAFSNGNYFVGDDEFTEFGANPDEVWQTRFNINFGYYF
jgi:hypothetical protein